MKKPFLFVLLLALLCSMMSCSSLFGPRLYDHTFINNSSYDLNILSNGQVTWVEFRLDSGQTRTISIPEDEIWFLYNHGSSEINVYHVYEGDFVWAFYDD